MVEEKGYTIRQIAELGLKKYKVHSYGDAREATIDAIRKRIDKIISQEGIVSVGMGKSTPRSKRPARTYSSSVIDKLLYEDLFDYFVELSQDEAIKRYVSPTEYEQQAEKYNGAFEDETLAILNHTPAEQHAIMDNQENTTVINEHDSVIREKKKEIMLEALFSRFYSLNIDELVEDANKVEFANTYKQGEFDRDDMRVFDRFNNWESYVDEKKQEDVI